MNPYILCIDMDGTIAEYEAQDLEDFFVDGYFLKLKPHKDLLHILKGLCAVIESYIVTVCITDAAKKEKATWLKQNFPEIPEDHWIFLDRGKSKGEQLSKLLGGLTKQCILLDDYTPNCLDWEKYGGTAIKIQNGRNCSGNVWRGLTLNVYTPHEEMYRN